MLRRTFEFDRRTLLAGGTGALLVTLLPRPAMAGPDEMAAAMREALGGAIVKPGRVKLELPALAENGNSVPLLVTVESPMTATDHVRTIYVLSEKNPSANVVRFHLTPRSGVARVQTSIRLADTQRITAVARMSDGSCWSGSAEVIVTLSACLDES